MNAAPASSGALYARLLTYVRPYARAFGIAVLGMIAAAATEPLFPALMKPLLDGGFGAGKAPVRYLGRFFYTWGRAEVDVPPGEQRDLYFVALKLTEPKASA